MRLSCFSVVDSTNSAARGAGRRYADFLALSGCADASGLQAVWVAEHHFHRGGLVPCPPVLLGAAAALTRRVRLGVMVSVLPFHSAVDIAEQYAMVDQLSGGRLNLGVGSGYLTQEFEGYGIDPSTKRDRFDRTFEELRRAFAGGTIRPPGGQEVHLNVRPVQRPAPPTWIAVQRREAVPFVARRAANLALVPYATLAEPSELAAQIAEYRASLPRGSRAVVSVALHLYAGERPARARAALQRYLDSRRATQSTFYAAKVHRAPEQARAEAIEAAGWALFGPPRAVADRLDAFAEMGVDEVLGMFDFGGLASEEVCRSVKGLARAVQARTGHRGSPRS